MGLFDWMKRVFGSGDRQEAARRADAGIERFWAFWRAHAEELSTQAGETMSDDLVRAVQSAVADIHPELDWEFGPGVAAEHSFTISGHGDAGLRLLAERWRRVAPASDHFDFFVTRQPEARDQLMGMKLGLADAQLSFSDVRLGLNRDENRRLVNVGIYHPAFTHLNEDARVQASFLILDDTLGEDGVERWVGELQVMQTAPEGGVDLLALLDEVAQLRALPEDTWCLGESTQGGLPLVHLVNLAAKRWDYPLFDTWCAVRLDYEGNDTGMPSPSDRQALDTLEDGLTAFLDDAGINLGRRTGAGYRETYFYIDGSTDSPQRLLAWTKGCGWPARLQVEEDPQWSRRP